MPPSKKSVPVAVTPASLYPELDDWLSVTPKERDWIAEDLNYGKLPGDEERRTELLQAPGSQVPAIKQGREKFLQDNPDYTYENKKPSKTDLYLKPIGEGIVDTAKDLGQIGADLLFRGKVPTLGEVFGKTPVRGKGATSTPSSTVPTTGAQNLSSRDSVLSAPPSLDLAEDPQAKISAPPQPKKPTVAPAKTVAVPDLTANGITPDGTVKTKTYTTLNAEDEDRFQAWYRKTAKELGLNANPDDPNHKYDYRAFWRKGGQVDGNKHFDSRFKDDDHPSRFILKGKAILDTKYGRPVPPDQFASLATPEQKATIERAMPRPTVTPQQAQQMRTQNERKMVEAGQNFTMPEPNLMDAYKVLPGMADISNMTEQRQAQQLMEMQRGGAPSPTAGIPNMEPPKPLSLGGAFEEAGKSFARGTGNASGSVLKGIARWSQVIDEHMGNEKKLDDYGTYKLGQNISKWTKEVFPGRPDLQKNFLLTTLFEGAGSSIPFLATGAAGAAIGGGAGTAAALTGALAGSDSMVEQAPASATKEQRRLGLVLGAGLGLTEGIPIADLFKRMNLASGGTLATAVKSGTVQAIEEAIQEGFQQLGENVVKKYVYNMLGQDLTEGTGEGAAAGGIIGFLTGFMLSGRGRLKGAAESASPEAKTGTETTKPTPPPSPPGLEEIVTPKPAKAAKPAKVGQIVNREVQKIADQVKVPDLAIKEEGPPKLVKKEEKPAGEQPEKIIDLTGAGKAISDNLYDRLWTRVQEGKVTELDGGKPSGHLQAAKVVHDAGGFSGVGDLRAFMGEFERATSGITGKERNAAINELVKLWSPNLDIAEDALDGNPTAPVLVPTSPEEPKEEPKPEQAKQAEQAEQAKQEVPPPDEIDDDMREALDQDLDLLDEDAQSKPGLKEPEVQEQTNSAQATETPSLEDLQQNVEEAKETLADFEDPTSAIDREEVEQQREKVKEAEDIVATFKDDEDLEAFTRKIEAINESGVTGQQRLAEIGDVIEAQAAKRAVDDDDLEKRVKALENLPWDPVKRAQNEQIVASQEPQPRREQEAPPSLEEQPAPQEDQGKLIQTSSGRFRMQRKDGTFVTNPITGGVDFRTEAKAREVFGKTIDVAPKQEALSTPELVPTAVQAKKDETRKPNTTPPGGFVSSVGRDEEGNPSFDYSALQKRPSVKQIMADWTRAGQPSSFTVQYGETDATFKFEELHGIAQWWDQGNGAGGIDRNKVLDALKAAQPKGESPSTAQSIAPDITPAQSKPAQSPPSIEQAAKPERELIIKSLQTGKEEILKVPAPPAPSPTPEQVAKPKPAPIAVPLPNFDDMRSSAVDAQKAFNQAKTLEEKQKQLDRVSRLHKEFKENTGLINTDTYKARDRFFGNILSKMNQAIENGLPIGVNVVPTAQEEKPKVESFNGILSLAADSPSKLRVSDVDRVMDEAGKDVEPFRKWLLSQDLTDKTRAAVKEWAPEEAAPPPTPEALAPTKETRDLASLEPVNALQDSVSASKRVADYVEDRLGRKTADGVLAFSNADLFKEMDYWFGGTQAEGKYTPKDAFDALEMGVNQYLKNIGNVGVQPTGSVSDAQETIDWIRKNVLDRIPTQQNRRTDEQDEFQQFSTPPDLALAMTWVANISKRDTALEPSAGLGGLALFADNAGATVYVNEYDQRRAGLLKTMGFDGVTTENAEQLNNILPDTIKPTVVVMNPPFSSTAGRKTGERSTANVFPHLEQALKRLEPGGRLVALIGKGKVYKDPKILEDWIKATASQYAYRARIGLSGEGYKKYGTTYSNQILIFDKVAPDNRAPVIADFTDVRDALPALKEVRDARHQPELPVSTPAGTRSEPVPSLSEGPSGPITTERPPAPPMGDLKPSLETSESGLAGGRPGERRPADGQRPASRPSLSPAQSGRPGKPISTAAEPSASDESEGGRKSDLQRPGSRTDGGSERGGLPAKQIHDELDLETLDAPEPKTSTDLGDSIYQDYTPSKFRVKGAKPHPGKLQESAALAAVEPANITYLPKISRDLIERGEVSLAQLEAVAYAGQAHEQILPDESRRGFFLGDGPGVGKGRTIAAIVMDNWNRGRKKAVWLSETQGLYDSAIRDWEDLGGNKADLSVINKTKLGTPIPMKQGLLFMTYSTLGSGVEVTRSGDLKTKNIKGGDPTEFVNTRLEQLTSWLGEDFDGVIVFDEAHNMANALSEEGEHGMTRKPSARALAGVDIQKRFPKARIVYSSATGATKLSALAYAERLGLWGSGTAFPKKQDFLATIGQAGLGAMELVAQNMKAMGSYISRNLSYDGVTYDKIEHELTPAQQDIYNEMGRAWQLVLKNFTQALELTSITSDRGGRTRTNNGRAKMNAYSRFWNAQLQFYNQILNSMQMPSVLTDMRKRIDAGESVVVQLTSTQEAALTRELDKVNSGEIDLGAIDLTPRQTLMKLVENGFPVQQFEEYRDEDGNTRSRPVMDSEGRPVVNKEAVQMREALLEKLGSLRVPDSPIDMIIKEFGVDTIAENTGRKERVLRYTNKAGEYVEEHEKNRTDAIRKSEVKDFLNDKRRILIFSEKGGTGESYHASLKVKNQRHRNHYLVQAGWRADKAVQGLGRTHRTNQKQPPRYILTMTNIKGHKRFLSTIARRLDQLGALTKGQRQAGSSGLLDSKDNLENEYATAAINQLYKDVVKNIVPDISFSTITEKIGLNVLDERGTFIESKVPNVPQFMNRLLTLEIYEQNLVFDEFKRRMDQFIEVAAAKGTLDVGMQTVRASGGIAKIEAEEIHKDPTTGATTNLVEFEATHRTQFVPASTPFPSFAKSIKTGRVFGVHDLGNRTDKDGNVTHSFRLASHVAGKYLYVKQEEFDRLYEKVSAKEAQSAWQQQIDKEPESHKERLSLVKDSILNIWNRLPTAFPNIVRLQDNDGDVHIGIQLNQDMADMLRTNFGKAAKMQALVDLKPSEYADEIIERGMTVDLANGWTVKRARVAGEQRIEIVGDNLYNSKDILTNAGAFSEKINFATRFFVPTGKESGTVLRRIFSLSPVIKAMKAAGNILKEERGSIPASPFSRATNETVGFQSSNPEVEQRVRAAKGGLGRPGLLSRVREHAGHIWRLISREFEHLPDTAEFSRLRSDLLKLSKYKGIAADEIQRELAAIVKPLNRQQYDQFEWKALLEDLQQEADAKRLLPFGYTAEQVQEDLENLNASIGQDSAVQEAWAKRQQLWARLKRDYRQSMDAIGFDVSKKLTKDNYFRHQVLEYAREHRMKGAGAKIRTPTGRGFLKTRKGSTADINANYVQAEFEVMAQMVYDTQLAKVIAGVDQSLNIRKSLQAQAKAQNNQALQAIINAGDERAALTDAALKGFRQRLGMHMSRIRKALGLGKDDPLSLSEIADIAEDSEHEASLSARGVFKVINERKVFVDQVLGEQKVEWQDLIPDTHELWQPREGNVFYMVDSVPMKMMRMLHESMLAEVALQPEMLRKVLAMGAPREQYVIPKEAKATLDQLSHKEHSKFVEANRHTLRHWKALMLAAPRRIIRYIARNTTGDMDAMFVGNSASFAKLPRAAKELLPVIFKETVLSGEVKEWVKRGGYGTTLQTQELGNLNDLKAFKLTIDRASKGGVLSIPLKVWNGYWQGARMSIDYMETMRRYAAYLSYLEQMQENKGVPKNFGASRKETVMALPDIRDRAFKLSNELLGAYDRVSVAGQTLRDFWVPFYSWWEVNATRYGRLAANAFDGGQGGKFLAKGALVTGKNAAAFLVKASFLWAALQAWNYLFFEDDEEELKRTNPTVGNRPHILFGRDEKGQIQYLAGVGALGDLLAWVGLDSFPGLVGDMMHDRITIGEAIQNAAKAPVNRVIQGITPMVKLPVELATGLSSYPDAFHWRTIQDKAEYLGYQTTFGPEISALMGKPGKPLYGMEDLSGLFVQRTDPKAAAYYTWQTTERKLLERMGKESPSLFWRSPKGEALHNWAVALRHKDEEAEKEWREQYIAMEKEKYGSRFNEMKLYGDIEKSLRAKAPLSGMTTAERDTIVKQLSQEDRDELSRAEEYYNTVMMGVLPAARRVSFQRKLQSQGWLTKGRSALPLASLEP